MTIKNNDTIAAFKEWQSRAQAEFDALAAKLLGQLDIIVSGITNNESLGFAGKLSVLAHYVGHGDPMQAFPFFDQTEFARWLSGESEPHISLQGPLIGLCVSQLTDTSRDGSPLERVLSHLQIGAQAISMVKLVSDTQKLLFDPWLLIEDHALGLCVRTRNILVEKEVRYLGQLVQMTELELLRYPGLGKKQITEMKEVLDRTGTRLGMMHPDLVRFNEEYKTKQGAGEP